MAVSSVPITAYWVTALDDDNYPNREKSVDTGNACAVLTDPGGTLCSFYRRGENARVNDGSGFYDGPAYRTEPAEMKQYGWVPFAIRKNTGYFRFGSVNFIAFSFSRKKPADRVRFAGKIKRYIRLQFCVVNDGAGENMNVEKIVKTYTYGNTGK